MGYLLNEKEESFDWFDCVKKVLPLSPCVIMVDQCVPLITSLQRCFPHSHINLDEWHINQNQKKNVSLWCRTIKRLDECRSMEEELYSLRRTGSISEFEQKRSQFETRFINPYLSKKISTPRWYTYLYRYHPKY